MTRLGYYDMAFTLVGWEPAELECIHRWAEVLTSEPGW